MTNHSHYNHAAAEMLMLSSVINANMQRMPKENRHNISSLATFSSQQSLWLDTAHASCKERKCTRLGVGRLEVFTWAGDVGQGWNGGSGLGFDHVRQLWLVAPTAWAAITYCAHNTTRDLTFWCDDPMEFWRSTYCAPIETREPAFWYGDTVSHATCDDWHAMPTARKEI